MRPRTFVWCGWAVTILFALFILAASVAPKLAAHPVATDSLQHLGWPASQVRLLGLLELGCLALYLLPHTRFLGAVLLTGLLGGAIAMQARVGAPLFSHVLFGVYLGIALWGGLWLRDGALRQWLPLRRDSPTIRS